jgi:hypothetical protein
LTLLSLFIELGLEAFVLLGLLKHLGCKMCLESVPK